MRNCYYCGATRPADQMRSTRYVPLQSYDYPAGRLVVRARCDECGERLDWLTTGDYYACGNRECDAYARRVSLRDGERVPVAFRPRQLHTGSDQEGA